MSILSNDLLTLLARTPATVRTILEDLARPKKPRVPTNTPPIAKKKRLEDKRRRSERKKNRKKPDLDD